MSQNSKWQIVGKDFNSPYIRNWIWTNNTNSYQELFGVSNPVIGIISRKDEIEYITDNAMYSWTKTHEEVKKKVLDNPEFLEQVIDKTNELGESFNKWSEDNIFNIDTSKLTNSQILGLQDEFIRRQTEMYCYGVLLPILDFGGFSFVENTVKKFLSMKLAESEVERYFSVFTSPVANSFSEDQEESLLEIMSEYCSDEWNKDVLELNLIDLKNKYPDFIDKLTKHTTKFAWVYYVYAGPAFSEKDFLGFIKDYIQKGISPTEKLNSIKKQKAEIVSLKEGFIKELSPDEFNKKILMLAGKMVWAKPRRKDYQIKSYYHYEKLQKEIGKRLYLSLSQVRSIPINMLGDFLESGEVDSNLVNNIYRLHVCIPENGDVLTLTSSEAQKFIDENVEYKAINYSEIKELKGTVSFAGLAKGKVKIINKPDDMSKMKDGDVLVSVATTPSIVPAMKKASAIVTDEGGLTCHASIVSRELGIVCITGVKIATEVLKDGDFVEVDANKGIIKILS